MKEAIDDMINELANENMFKQIIEDLKKENAELKENNSNWIVGYGYLMKKEFNLRTENEDLEGKIEDLEGKIEDLEGKIEDLEEQLKYETEERDEYCNDYDDEKSRSDFIERMHINEER